MRKKPHPLTAVERHIAEGKAQVERLEEELREARHDLELWERAKREISDPATTADASGRQGGPQPRKRFKDRILAMMRDEPRTWLVQEIIDQLRARHGFSTDANNVGQYLHRLREDGLVERGGVAHAWKLSEKGSAP